MDTDTICNSKELNNIGDEDDLNYADFNLDDEKDIYFNKENMKKNVYQELAEKEQALLLAAQFGKNLIDEKEELENKIEIMKREQLNQIETFEQESYQMKRLMDQMRNEYEAKIYELNEDINFLSKQLKEKDQYLNKNMNSLRNENYNLELINELNEKNEKLKKDLKTNEVKLLISNENNSDLEMKLNEKDKALHENSKLLSSYQLEISKLMNKQQEIELALIQSLNERDNQSKIIEELTSKYLMIESEKNDLENLIYQNENEMYKLRKINQNLIYKLEKSNENLSDMYNTGNNINGINNRKSRKSYIYHALNNSNANNSNISFLKQASINNKPINYSNRKALLDNNVKPSLPSDHATTNNSNSNLSSSFSNNIFDDGIDQENKLPISFIYNNAMNLSDDFKHHETIDVISENDLDLFQINEIEQDDDDDEEEDKSFFFSSVNDSKPSSNMPIDGINWQQEQQSIEEADESVELSKDSNLSESDNSLKTSDNLIDQKANTINSDSSKTNEELRN